MWRAQEGLNQKQASERLGLPFGTYQKYEAGVRTPGGDAIESFVRAGIDANWLLTGEGRMRRQAVLDAPPPAPALPSPMVSRDAQPAADPADYVALPLYDVRAAAGGGIVPDTEQIVDFLYFKRAWVRAELRCSPDDLYLIYVDGESMEPTLRPGDVILVNHRDQSQTRDGIYVLRLDGALLVKRLQRLPGGVIKVTSDNLAYAPFEVATRDLEADDMAIIGRVVWAGRRM